MADQRPGLLREEQIERLVRALAIGNVAPARQRSARRLAGDPVVGDAGFPVRDMGADHERIECFMGSPGEGLPSLQDGELLAKEVMSYIGHRASGIG